jgi:peptidoglycan/LPS O-acetylase OafA/YrhL
LQFRKDINGLRAIAVLAVILFHFKPNWVPGGFVGVDIFFVISGFLMTGIIFSQLAKNQFSITAFYLARANRIIPALAFLCLVLLGLGWFYLSPDDYADLGKHAASSTVFVSNFVYWGEAGYFAAVAHEKWLLHTWSLSVEWQFYIAYPVILVLLSKILPLRILKIVILLAAVLGFVFCIIATGKWFVAAYYLLPMRAWEMLVGGIAFLYPLQSTNRVKKVAGWAGISLVLISCFVISKNVSWPGYMAALPVIGSFLLLQSQQANSLITGNIVFQKIGLWSYSIYLWHWPLVVAIHYFSFPDTWVYPAMLRVCQLPDY